MVSYRQAIARMRIGRGRSHGRFLRRVMRGRKGRRFRGTSRARLYFKRKRMKLRRHRRRPYSRRRRRRVTYGKKPVVNVNQWITKQDVPLNATTGTAPFTAFGMARVADITEMLQKVDVFTSPGGVETVETHDYVTGTISDAFIQVVLCTGVWTYQVIWRNNYAVPCNLAIYYSQVKENYTDTTYGVNRIIAGIDRIAGVDSGWENRPELHLSDSKDWFKQHKLLMKKYVTLQPGDEFRKTFKFKIGKFPLSKFTDIEGGTMIKYVTRVCTTRLWGVVAHESAGSACGFAPARCDCIVIGRCKYWVEKGGISRLHNYSGGTYTTTLTTPAVREATDPAKETSVNPP